MSEHTVIVACIDAHPRTNVLLRAAAHKAKELDGKWIALYIETPEHYTADRETRERILRFLTLAQQMGAEVYQIENNSVYDGITAFVQESYKSGISLKHVIIGESNREGFFADLKPSLGQRIAHDLSKFSIKVETISLAGKHYAPNWFERLQLRDVKFKEISYALFTVGIAFAVSELLRAKFSYLEWQVNQHNVISLFLIACVISSLRFGLIPGLVAAITGFATINYFYIAPLDNFILNDSGEGFTLSVFLVSSVVVSFMGAFSRATNAALIRKERRAQALYKVYRLASEATERTQAIEILHEELARLLEMEVAFFLPTALNPDDVELVYPKTVEFSEKDMRSLQTCWDEVRTTGLGTLNRFGSAWRFEPLVTAYNEMGVMAVRIPAHMRLDAMFGRLLTALADQAAAILERIDLTKMMSESRMSEEREKLRSMLLSSVSHDLKTPLASIIGSMSVYQRMHKAGRLDEDTAIELTQTTLDEAQRLDSFITNILDMTRIESGEITFHQEWVDATIPVQNVRKRLRQRLVNHELVVMEPSKEYEVYMDKMMTEQVIQNVIDNAVKYSPAHTKIYVGYGMDDKGFYYSIRDCGGGIPEDKLTAIFDKYERLKQSDSQVAGTGLGLAISKAVMEKQAGSITVRNHEAGGAEFILRFEHARMLETLQAPESEVA